MITSGALAAIVVSVVAAVLLFVLLILLQKMCGRARGTQPYDPKKHVVYKPTYYFKAPGREAVSAVDVCRRQGACVGVDVRKPSVRALSLAGADNDEDKSDLASCVSDTVPALFSPREASVAVGGSLRRGHRGAQDTLDYDAGHPHIHLQCVPDPMHDYGPGLASCYKCHRKPILNRGCKRCNKFFCPPCFAAHKEERVSLLELSEVTMVFYTEGSEAAAASSRPSVLSAGVSDRELGAEQWQKLMRDLSVEGDAKIANAVVNRARLAMFLALSPQYTEELIGLLRKEQCREFGLIEERGMAVPECGLETAMHERGTGLTTCVFCHTKTPNRGCRNCGMKLCERCFVFHCKMAKLADAAMRIDQQEIQRMEREESAIARAAEHSAKKAALDEAQGGEAAEPAGRQLPADLAVRTPLKGPKGSQEKVVNTVDFLDDPANVEHLRRGGALYTCGVKEIRFMTEKQRRMGKTFVNISAFDDELKENSVPYVDPLSEDSTEYIMLLNKGMYLFPPQVRVQDLNSRVLSSVEFHKNCQPGSGMKKTRVWTDVSAHHTFRLTKVLIPLLFSVTFQMRCSVVPKSVLASLSILCDDLVIHHVCRLAQSVAPA